MFVLQEQHFLTISNYLFTLIFGLEMFVKVSIIQYLFICLLVLLNNALYHGHCSQTVAMSIIWFMASRKKFERSRIA